jgi:DNA modification methylase
MTSPNGAYVLFGDASPVGDGLGSGTGQTSPVASPTGDGGEEVTNDMPLRRRLVVAETRKHQPDTLSVSDALDHARQMPDSSVDLVVFSPPYDGVRDYRGEWSIDLPALGVELLRVVKDGCFAVVVIGDGTKNQRKSMTTFRTAVAWEDAGWALFESVIYSRDGRPGAWWATRFRVDHEHILIFFKGKRPRPVAHHDGLRVPSKHAGKKWTGTQRLTDGTTVPITATVADTKCRGTIWHYATSNSEGNRVKMAHPATYPDALARDLILALSAEGDVVYDPMVGSGTSCVVAAQHDRRWIGNDVSTDYIDIARQRLAVEADAYEAPTCCTECGNDDAAEGYTLCLSCLELVAA